MRCDGCGREKDDVAVVGFQWVISVIFVCFRNPVVGAYCKRCRVIRGIGLSVVSAVVGWWAFWGVIYTPAAIFKNIANIFKSTTATIPLTARIVARPISASNEHAHHAVEIRGQCSLPVGRACGFRHSLVDITNPADPMPVYALLDWQQAAGSRVFLDTTEIGVTERGQYLDLTDWVDMKFPIFAEATQAPHSGHRELLSIVELVAAPDTVLWSSETPFSLHLPLGGYVEDHAREVADDALIVRMAVAVAASSHGMSEPEIEAVRVWSKTRLAALDEGGAEFADRANDLAGALARSMHDAESGRLDLGATITRFLAEGSDSGRIEAVELCLAVMRVDGTADHDEMLMINRLANQLGIDEAWFAENRDKSVSGLTTHADSAMDFATLLGIDPASDKDTIRLQLNEQYDRWNSRAVSLSDPGKRREAEAMLETIAKARQELLP